MNKEEIFKNLWYDYCKKNKKVISVEEELLESYSTDTTEERVILNDEKTREVIYLRITGELSFKEIGIILNKTENWARVTFYRGTFKRVSRMSAHIWKYAKRVKGKYNKKGWKRSKIYEKV